MLKKEQHEFDGMPVTYNRPFKSNRDERKPDEGAAPITKARAAHPSYSRHKPIVIPTPEPAEKIETPVPVEKIETPEQAESAPKKTKVALVLKKPLLPKKLGVLDHRKLPGTV